MTGRATSNKESVLVLDEELERRVTAAARLVKVSPTEFIVRAIARCAAEALGEVTEPIWPDTLTGGGFAARQRGVGTKARGLWAIRPTQSRVLRSVAEAAGMSIETLLGVQGSPATSRARAVAAYLLRRDAGLSILDAARVLHRKTNTVHKLIVSVEQVVGTDDARAQLLERARRLFKNGLSSGCRIHPYQRGCVRRNSCPGCWSAAWLPILLQPRGSRSVQVLLARHWQGWSDCGGGRNPKRSRRWRGHWA